MAERSGFFDAHASVDDQGNIVYDRTYLAESFAKYFASFIGNGIFGGKSDELMVRQKETADMSINVLSGQAFINGYFYENTDELSLAIDNADGILNRIDLIVLRWDKYERVISLVVEKGAPASSPSAPSLKRNDDYYELELAKISVKAGATRITQADITDSRLNSDVCGFVVAVIDHFDTAAFNAQLYAWIDEFKLDSVEKVNDLLEAVQEILDASDLGPIIVDIQELKTLATKSKIAADDLNTVTEIGFYSMPGEKAVNHPAKMRYSYFGTLIVEHREDDIIHQTVRRENQFAFRYSTDDGATWSEWEYLNPIYEVGVEYRTLKRKRGLAVFEMLGSDGVLKYRLEGSSTWNAYAAEKGAVNKAGDTMTGSLAIKTPVTPTLSLVEGSGASSVFQIWNNMLLLSNKNSADDENNYRFLSIANSNIESNIANAIGISDVVNGVERFYHILHSGNLSMFGLGVAPASVE